MPESLAGKVAIVTGGGSGIGAAIVQRLEAAGAVCHAISRRGPVRVDVSDRRAVETFVGSLDRVDVLVWPLASFRRRATTCQITAGAEFGPSRSVATSSWCEPATVTARRPWPGPPPPVAFLDPPVDRYPARMPAAFRKLDAVAVPTGPFLPTPQTLDRFRFSAALEARPAKRDLTTVRYALGGDL